MPTDIVELSITASCMVGMTLARSELLTPRDGLGTSALAATVSAVCTLLLIAANVAAFLLSVVLPDTVAPMLAIVSGAGVTALMALSLKKFANAALQRLLLPLAPAIFAGVLVLSGLTALIAPSQHVLHAAFTAVGAGFSFALLLQLCVLLNAVLTSLQPQHSRTLPALSLPQYQYALTMLVAAVLAMVIVTMTGQW
jgi:hypothetical protein